MGDNPRIFQVVSGNITISGTAASNTAILDVGMTQGRLESIRLWRELAGATPFTGVTLEVFDIDSGQANANLIYQAAGINPIAPYMDASLGNLNFLTRGTANKLLVKITGTAGGASGSQDILKVELAGAFRTGPVQE